MTAIKNFLKKESDNFIDKRIDKESPTFNDDGKKLNVVFALALDFENKSKKTLVNTINHIITSKGNDDYDDVQKNYAKTLRTQLAVISAGSEAIKQAENLEVKATNCSKDKPAIAALLTVKAKQLEEKGEDLIKNAGTATVGNYHKQIKSCTDILSSYTTGEATQALSEATQALSEAKQGIMSKVKEWFARISLWKSFNFGKGSGSEAKKELESSLNKVVEEYHSPSKK